MITTITTSLVQFLPKIRFRSSHKMLYNGYYFCLTESWQAELQYFLFFFSCYKKQQTNPDIDCLLQTQALQRSCFIAFSISNHKEAILVGTHLFQESKRRTLDGSCTKDVTSKTSREAGPVVDSERSLFINPW